MLRSKYFGFILLVVFLLSGCGLIGEKSKSNSDSPKEMKEPSSYLQKEGYQGKVKRVTERQIDSKGQEIITVIEISPEGNRISEKRVNQNKGAKVEDIKFFDQKERIVKRVENGVVIEEKQYDDIKREYSGFSGTAKITGKLNQLGLPIEENSRDDVNKTTYTGYTSYDEKGNSILGKSHGDEVKFEYDSQNRRIKMEIAKTVDRKQVTSILQFQRNSQGWTILTTSDLVQGNVKKEFMREKMEYPKVDAKGNWVERLKSDLIREKEPVKTTRTIEYYE